MKNNILFLLIGIFLTECTVQKMNGSDIANSISILNRDGSYFYLPLKSKYKGKEKKILITNFELYNLRYNLLNLQGEFTDTLVSIVKKDRVISDSIGLFDNYIVDDGCYKKMSTWSTRKIYRKYFDSNGDNKNMFSEKEMSAAVYAILERGIVVVVPSYSNAQYKVSVPP